MKKEGYSFFSSTEIPPLTSKKFKVVAPINSSMNGEILVEFSFSMGEDATAHWMHLAIPLVKGDMD